MRGYYLCELITIFQLPLPAPTGTRIYFATASATGIRLGALMSCATFLRNKEADIGLLISPPFNPP